MAFLTWDRSYCVQVAELDGHHQKLFYLANCLCEAMREGQENTVLRGIVKELVNYTNTHFQREEALLEQAKFPGLEGHRIAHRKLMRRVTELKDALESGRGANPAVLLEFLRNWMTNHIHGMDRSYSSHLNAKGIH